MNRHADPEVLYFHPIPDAPAVSQPFGASPEVYARAGMAGHNGIDFEAPVGTDVFANIDGRVVHAGPGADGRFAWLLGNAAGLTVLILHTIGGRRLITGYAHLSSVAVALGDTVEGGQLIGRSGATGYVGGPHLHFEAMTLGPGGELDTGNGYLGRIDPSALVMPRG